MQPVLGEEETVSWEADALLQWGLTKCWRMTWDQQPWLASILGNR